MARLRWISSIHRAKDSRKKHYHLCRTSTGSQVVAHSGVFRRKKHYHLCRTSTVGAAAPSVDTSTTGDGGEDLPQNTAEAESTDFRDNQVFQLAGSYLFGVAEGVVPFVGFGHSLGDAVGLIGERPNAVKFGLAIGQIVGGVIATIGGIGGEVLGGAATVTGVGAAIGVPVMVVSAVAVTGGIANIVAGSKGWRP